MKKQYWVFIILVVLVLAYLGKHRIKVLLQGTTNQQPVQTVTTIPSATGSGTIASNSADPVMTKSTSAKGNYLVDPNSMTLYIFDKDKPGVSNCSGSCAALWPPYTTGSVPSTLPANVTTIRRTDGTLQFTYKGMPLYYYTPDKQPGDTTGDGVGGVWHLVKP